MGNTLKKLLKLRILYSISELPKNIVFNIPIVFNTKIKIFLVNLSKYGKIQQILKSIGGVHVKWSHVSAGTIIEVNVLS